MANTATAEAPKKRIRRSPEEARALILSAAKSRLKAVGPEGLQIKEIAAIAGVTHSTILHHFGSAEDLRISLAEQMVEELLNDILAVMETHEERDDRVFPEDHTVLFRVFEVLSDEGHARLLAWNMLRGGDLSGADNTLTALFKRIQAGVVMAIKAAAGDMVVNDEVAERHARFIIYLVATTAVGDGIAGPNLAEQIGLTEAEATKDFRDWFAARLF